MKVVILGAQGQLGRALATTAPRAAQVIALGRTECDLTDTDGLGRVIKAIAPDLIFNAAAYTAVDRAEGEPDLAHAVNAVAPGVIARAAREAGARFAHLSTDFVFGPGAGVPHSPWAPTAPAGVYARTKREGEERVAAVSADALIVRTAWVYAARGSNFVNTMLRLMRERDSLDVVDDQIGSPTWATSLAGALWALIAADARGLHHFTDAGVASWFDFAVAIEEEARALGLLSRPVRIAPIATADFPTAAVRPSYSVLDKRATWRLLGGAPPHWRINLRANLQDLKHG